MPVRRRTDKRRGTISPGAWALLNDEASPDGGVGDLATFLLLRPDHGGDLRELWGQFRQDVMARWIARYPGTRPTCWWRFDAPRIPPGRWRGWYFDGTLPEPRRRLGGSGRPAWEELALVPAFDLGIPAYWIQRDDADPPMFESQAAFLRRNAMFVPGEAERLTAADFRAEKALGGVDYDH